MSKPAKAAASSEDGWVDLPVADLHKPIYQRDVNAAWVERMAKAFNPDLLQVPDVSYRDGKWWVIDGLHRRDLIRKVRGNNAVMRCRPHYNLTEMDEFFRFMELNRNRRRVSALEQFKGALALGQTAEVTINNVVVSFGLSITGSHRALNHMGATRVLYDIYRSGGEPRLRRVLHVYTGTYGVGAEKPNGIAVDALGIVYRKYGKVITDERMIRMLAVNGTVWQLIGMSLGTGSGHGSVNVANAVIKVYNKGLRNANKLALLGGMPVEED